MTMNDDTYPRLLGCIYDDTHGTCAFRRRNGVTETRWLDGDGSWRPAEMRDGVPPPTTTEEVRKLAEAYQLEFRGRLTARVWQSRDRWHIADGADCAVQASDETYGNWSPRKDGYDTYVEAAADARRCYTHRETE